MKNFLVICLCLISLSIFGAAPLPIVRNPLTTNNLANGNNGQVLTFLTGGLIGWADQTGGGVSLAQLLALSQIPVTNGLVVFTHPKSGYTFSGSTTVSNWYDASGFSNHLTQTTATNAPYGTQFGAPLFWRGDFLGVTNQFLTVPSGLTLNVTNHSVFLIIKSGSSYYSQGLWQPTGLDGSFFLFPHSSNYKGQLNSYDSGSGGQRYTTNNAENGISLIGQVSAANGVRLYRNGLVNSTTAYSGASFSGGRIGVFNGANSFYGEIWSVMIFNRPLADEEVQALEKWANAVFATRSRSDAQIIYDGDSISYGAYQDSLGSAPAKLAELEKGWRVVNVATPSSTVTNLITVANIAVDALLDPAIPKSKRVVVLEAGSNDAAGSDTAGWVYTNIVRYATDRRTNALVIIRSITPRNDGTFETKRAAINQNLRTNWINFADGFSDVGADPDIGDQADATDTKYYIDGIHTTPLGSAIMAKYDRAAIINALNKSSNIVLEGSTGFKGPTTNLVQNIAIGGIIDFSLGNEFRGTLTVDTNLYVTNMSLGQMGKVVLTNSASFQSNVRFDNTVPYLAEGYTNSPSNQEYYFTVIKTLAGYFVSYPNTNLYPRLSGSASSGQVAVFLSADIVGPTNALNTLQYNDNFLAPSSLLTNYLIDFSKSEYTLNATNNIRFVAFSGTSSGFKIYTGLTITNNSGSDKFIDLTNVMSAGNTFTNRLSTGKFMRISLESEGNNVRYTGIVQP